jgi:tetratricopeptide (TPR) repeat protein
MFKLHSSRRGFPTELLCTACGHSFRRELHRIYVDAPTFEQHQIRKQATQRSEYIIPQRIACPKCQAVDQYELTESTLSSLLMAMTAALLAGRLAKEHSIQLISLALSNGQPIHPLDALEKYRQEVSAIPNNQAARSRYAKILLALGYFDEAEAEYTRVLDQNPGQLEAWYHLAAVHVALKHKSKAKKALQSLVEQAGILMSSGGLTPFIESEIQWVHKARHYLDGDSALDTLTPPNIFKATSIRPSMLKSKRPVE